MTFRIPALSTAVAAALLLVPQALPSAAAAPLHKPMVSVEGTTGTVADAQFRDNRYYGRKGGPRYRGYRGHRYKRPGYRRHNGWWYPPAAFIIGGIINEALRDNRRVYRGNYSRRHHRWCDRKYRSYRRSDGTFQPYGNRPRRRCNSPFDGI